MERNNTEALTNNEKVVRETVIVPEQAEEVKVRDSLRLRDKLQKTLDLFRSKLNFVGLKKEDEDQLQEEVSSIEKQATIDGVDFSRIQIEKVLADRDSGKNVEFETLSQYLCDYNVSTGEIWEDKLTPADTVGLRLGKTFRQIFPKARLISLWDAYNTSMTDTSDPRGAPMGEGKQIVIPDEIQERFKDNSVALQKKAGGIPENGVEGVDYLYISESLKVKDAEELVRRLETAGYIERIVDAEDREEINFVNPQAENPIYRKINLKTRNDRWLCEALDASSYIKPENLEITHIVVLPNSFKEQQNKVWEMLRVLGLEPLNYHNIFYDDSIEQNGDKTAEELAATRAEKVARVIEDEFNKYEVNKQRLS